MRYKLLITIITYCLPRRQNIFAKDITMRRLLCLRSRLVNSRRHRCIIIASKLSRKSVRWRTKRAPKRKGRRRDRNRAKDGWRNGRRRRFRGNRAKINVEENLIRASSLVDSFSLFLSYLSFSPGDLDGSADVSFHNLIVLIKFRRGIALRWAYRPGGHNANRDVYRMNREWNSKWVCPVTFSDRTIRFVIFFAYCGDRAL